GANTVGLLYAAPRIREHFVAWKAMSAGIIALAFVVTYPSLTTFVGAFVVVALATFLRNAKAFIVIFLSFWYLVINDKGATPALDFAGFYGKATPSIIATYALIGLALLAAATLLAAMRRRR